jgi:hypothetical protein
LRYYPNRAVGDIKDSRSYEIFFNKDAKTFENIEGEIVENYEHDVVDIIPSSFNQFIVRFAKDEQKNVIYFMYRDDQEITLDYKAVSEHPLLKEDSVFLAM